MADAILGTFVKVSTMADGTPRITLDMQCSLSELAALATEPGAVFALARITPEAAKQQARQQTIDKEEKEPIGALCKWLVMRSNEPEFQEFVRKLYDIKLGGDGTGTGDLEFDSPQALVKHAVLAFCEINSRKELDTDPVAARKFREEFMAPWTNSTGNPWRGEV